jgi:hypothetical protein
MAGLNDFWIERIEALKAAIVAHEAAIAALTTGGMQSYELESGQTRQKVTMSNLGSLRTNLNQLMNDLSVLEARVCGTAALRVVPGW